MHVGIRADLVKRAQRDTARSGRQRVSLPFPKLTIDLGSGPV